MVDHHQLFTECLGVVLTTRGYDYRTVRPPATSRQLPQVQARLLALHPDVAIINVDLRTPGDGVALLRAVAQARIPVIAVCDDADESRWGRYLAAGAHVVVSKAAPLSSMVSTVRRIAQGQRVLDPRERMRLLTLSRRDDAERQAIRLRLARLSVLESAVLRHLMAGRTVREIATLRVVAEGTVRTQVKAVLSKLEVSSQLTAVALAHEAGWTTDEMGFKAG